MRSFFRIVLFLFFVGYSGSALANRELDSLIGAYKKAKHDTVRMKTALRISWNVRDNSPADSLDLKYLHEVYLNTKLSNYPRIKMPVCRALAEAYKRFAMYNEAIRYMKEAVAVASALNDYEAMASQLSNMSYMYDHIREHEKALQTLIQAYEKAKKTKNDDLKANLCNGIAGQYYQLGKAEEAIKYFYTSLEIFESKKDTGRIVMLLRNISLAYGGLKDFVRTKQLLFRSLELSLAAKDSDMISSSYGSLGAMYQNTLQFDSALICNSKTLSYMPANVDSDSKGIAYGNLGVIYKAQKRYAEAKASYIKAADLFKKNNSYRLITISNINLGELCIIGKEFKKAISFYDEALKQSEASGELDILTAVHKGKYEAFYGMKDYKSALDEYGKARVLEDSMKKEQDLTKILRMESEYEVGKKQKENEVLKAQNKVKETLVKVAEENERKTKIFLYSALFVIVLIMVLAVLLYKGLKENKEKTKIISEQKHIVEEKNKDITDSINYAKKIQEAILPSKELKYELFPDAFVFFKPRDIVSGDFYWYTEKDGKRIITAVDCTGHGVPGAFMSMIGNTFLTEIIEGKGITQPAEILSELRHLVIKALKQSDDMTENKDGMDMAILCFDDKNKTVEFAGANNPMWMYRNGECIEYKGDKRPIGYYRGQGLPFTNHKIDCVEGDCFYIFTDGYADQFGGPNGKKLKYKQLMQFLTSIQKQPMLKQEEILNERFNEWKGPLDQIDDVLIIGVRV